MELPPRAGGRGAGGVCGWGEYAEAAAALRPTLSAPPRLPLDRCPGLSADALLSIHSQECKLQMRQSFGFHRRPEQQREYAERWRAGESLESICETANLPPCHLVRFVGASLLGLTPAEISRLLRQPREFLCEAKAALVDARTGPGGAERLLDDVRRACAADCVSSPATSTAQRVAGLEHEALLLQKLRAAGVAFWTEDQLRARGALKTPDVQLKVPIAVWGRVVTWIDSKASFGSESSYRLEGRDQFQKYVNRIGPGLVIYWFGLVEGLGAGDGDVLLLGDFPPPEAISVLKTLPECGSVREAAGQGNEIEGRELPGVESMGGIGREARGGDR